MLPRHANDDSVRAWTRNRARRTIVEVDESSFDAVTKSFGAGTVQRTRNSYSGLADVINFASTDLLYEARLEFKPRMTK